MTEKWRFWHYTKIVAGRKLLDKNYVFSGFPSMHRDFPEQSFGAYHLRTLDNKFDPWPAS